MAWTWKGRDAGLLPVDMAKPFRHLEKGAGELRTTLESLEGYVQLEHHKWTATIPMSALLLVNQ